MKNSLAAPVFKDSFPIPEKIARQMWFWEAVFSKYHADATIIHDWNDPEIIIDIIDFKVFSKQYNGGFAYTNKDKKVIVDKYMTRYRLAIDRLVKEGSKAVSYGQMEARVYKVYGQNRKSMQRMMSGKVVMRAQEGLADEFARAAERARDYLPYMEKIFKDQGISSDLTRIVFVESMFNPFALSKVGASGIWQFMPGTGKNYLHINALVDERQAPLKATRAAAELLKLNYSILGNWPMAITAYNYGASGLVKASKQLKTKDMGEIVENFRSDRFGFASRNFYAEFLAARNVYKRYYMNNLSAGKTNPLNIAKIRLRKPMSMSELIRDTPLKADIVREYNLCIRSETYNSRQYNKLPENYEIVVPKDLEGQINFALNRLYQNTKYTR